MITGKNILSGILAVMLCIFTGCQSAADSQTSEETTAEQTVPAETETTEGTDRQRSEEQMIYAHIGDKTLTILPADNSSAEAFLELLAQGDVTVEMHDYGNFEKVGALGTSLPTNDESITTEPGDVILYQGNSVTIYYDENTWSFTRLGKVQDLSQKELKEILGSGDVSVTFSLG